MTADLQAWVGREIVVRDELCLAPAFGLAALLDRAADGVKRGSALPCGWHWIYFAPRAAHSDLDVDGHTRRGGFLPPASLPRRMWVGGAIHFRQPLVLGDTVERRSTIASVQEKAGRSGRLVFVAVRHLISAGTPIAIDEVQELVFRDPARPGEARPGGSPPPGDCHWRESFRTDAVALFRFSALTFNSHRIHYDHPYATQVEGYPGLVVHAPLTALLLLDAACRHQPIGRVATYTYRAEGPLFCEEAIGLHGRIERGSMVLWATAPDGRTAMKAKVEWAT